MEFNTNLGLFAFVLTCVAAAIGVVTVTILVGSGDQNDIVDVKGLGEIICNEHNLTYDHREWKSPKNIPIIYCRSGREEKIIDDIVKKIGD